MHQIGINPPRKGLLSWCCCLLLTLLALPLAAQNSGFITGKTYKAPPVYNSDFNFQPSFAAGLVLGTSSVPGLDVAFQPVPWMYLRLGYHHFRFVVRDREINTSSFGFGDQNILISSDMIFSHVLGTWEAAPTKKHNFRIVLGLGLGLDNRLSGKFEFKDPVMINDLEITPEEIGFIKGVYTTDQVIFPYAGIGVGRSVPSRRINVTCDAGCFYRGAPRFTIESTNLFENNEENAAVLENNFSSWRWQPTINVRLGVRLNE